MGENPQSFDNIHAVADAAVHDEQLSVEKGQHQHSEFENATHIANLYQGMRAIPASIILVFIVNSS